MRANPLPERTRAIARTLNARYKAEPYGLGPDNATTTYPVSAFVTHMVHLRESAVHVDVALISVRLSVPAGPKKRTW
jgi:hypothetical protein